MNTGILTFHASHNYGSMLQAYALQQTVLSLGHECEIINFRTQRQRRFYRPFFIKGGFRSKIKAILFPRIAIDDRRKYRLFEQFIRDNLRLSGQEYATEKQLRDAALPYDAIIAGSDQIWNISCFDHDSAYFLSFARPEVRKIAYAPSMGPEPHRRPEFSDSIRIALAEFAAISVRESGTADRIGQITGRRPAIAVDPTLLLAQEQWLSLIPQRRIHEKDYILLYTPWYNEHIFNEAAGLAEKWDIDVVVTQSHYSHLWRKNRHFKFITATGPLEFLNLIGNAKLIVSGSFHAVVFSLLLDRQFYAVDGMADARISNLLNLTGLQNLARKPEMLIDAAETARLCTAGRQRLDPLRRQSVEFLKNALGS